MWFIIYKEIKFKKHLLTHTGEKQYSFEICGSSFSTNSNNSYAMTGWRKPYSCEVQNVKFETFTELIFERIHAVTPSPWSARCESLFDEWNDLFDPDLPYPTTSFYLICLTSLKTASFQVALFSTEPAPSHWAIHCKVSHLTTCPTR